MSMRPPHLLGLTGYAGSGKDTTRDILAKHGYFGMAFADPIREMLKPLLLACGIDLSYMTARHLKEQPMPVLGVSYRQLAQTLGTEWGRAQAPDFWLKIAAASMTEVSLSTFGPPNFVISDVRFPNEAEWIRQQGGQVWRVDRADVEHVRQHTSEALINWIEPDVTLDNNGSIGDLHSAVKDALARQSSTEETQPE